MVQSITVLGSSHLDILSHISDHDETLDRPGDLFITYGGTGFNMAINLATFGNKVTFGTILSDTYISRTIVASLQRFNVNVRPDYRSDLPEAGFSAHISSKGEMMSAVTSTPVERLLFSEDHMQGLILQSNVVVLDCNLNIQSIIHAVQLANTHKKPVFIAGVSESKSTKVIDLIEAGGCPTGLFINAREMRFIADKLKNRFNHPVTGDVLAQFCNCLVVETDGEKGVRVWGPGSQEPLGQTKKTIIRQTVDGETTNWLGAGDHLMSLTIHRHFDKGETIPQAAVIASEIVTERHGQKNCNLCHDNPLEERLKYLTDAALCDPLTKLLNRRGLEDYMQQLSQDTNITILMMDIDHFKSVNDNYGHDIGDSVLSEVASLLAMNLRVTDGACRWGGEEMIAILPQTDSRTGKAVAERIRQCIEEYFFKCGKVTISIGISTRPMREFTSMLEDADKALYAAKKNGRNQVVDIMALPSQK